MTDKKQNGWQEKDIRDVIPEKVIPLVSTFCRQTIRDSGKSNFDADSIVSKAKVLLSPHAQAFNAIGTDVGFFSYWLQNAWNQGKFEVIIKVLDGKN